MSAIGSAINSLPIAYAPLNATGRYIAYALTSASGVASVAPSGTFTVAPQLAIYGESGGAFEALRYAPAATAVTLSADISVRGDILAIAEATLVVSGGTVSAGAKAKPSAAVIAAAIATSLSTSLKILSGACDFTSLYTLPGRRSSGHAINAFAVNAGAINSRTGQYRKTFEMLFNPAGSIVADGNAVITATGGDGLSAGSVLCDGAAVCDAGDLTCTTIPNAIFSPIGAGASEASTAIMGGAVRRAEVAPAATGEFLCAGNIVADGSMRLLRLYGPYLGSFALNSTALNALPAKHEPLIDSSMTAVGSYIAGPPLSIEIIAQATSIGNMVADGASMVACEAIPVGTPNAVWAGLLAAVASASEQSIGNTIANGEAVCASDGASTCSPVLIAGGRILNVSEATALFVGNFISGGALADLVGEADALGYSNATFGACRALLVSDAASLGYANAVFGAGRCLLASVAATIFKASSYWNGNSVTSAEVSTALVGSFIADGSAESIVTIGADVVGNFISGGALADLVGEAGTTMAGNYRANGLSSADVLLIVELDGLRVRIAWFDHGGVAAASPLPWYPIYGPITTVYADKFDDDNEANFTESVTISAGPFRQLNPRLASLGAVSLNTFPVNALDSMTADDIETDVIVETIVYMEIPTSTLWGLLDL